MDQKPLNVFLVYFCHGVDGYASDWAQMERCVNEQFELAVQRLPAELAQSATRLFTYKLAEYAGRKTYAGVERLGTVAAEEITDHVAKTVLPEFAPDNPSSSSRPIVLRLAIVGHSLGGLVARYAVSLLLAGQNPMLPSLLAPFPTISVEPWTFMTVCTPHLGSRVFEGQTYASTAYARFLRLAATTVYQRSGQELFLVDADSLLTRMSDPRSDFVATLSLFRHRTLIGLAAADIVPYASALIQRTYPYGLGDKLPTSKGAYGFHVLDRCGFDDDVDLELFGESTAGVGPWTAKLDPPALVSPDARFDPSISSDSPTDVNSQPISPAPESYLLDSASLCEYLPSMLRNLQSITWRRVSLYLALPMPFSLGTHAMVIGKAPWFPAGVANVARESTAKIAAIIVADCVRGLSSSDVAG